MLKKIAKKIYEVLPGKKLLFSVLRKLPVSPSLYQHLHFKDWIRVRVDEGSFAIYHHGYQVENDIFWSGIRGNWERQSLDLWIMLCRQSKTILDIGANTGVYSLVAGAVNPQARIFAFEPSKHVAEKLKKNLSANSFNITLVQAAVSREKGTATFYDTDEHNYTGSLNSSHGSNTKSYTVPTITLDSFAADNRLRIDLVKIDVEKHEPEVLEGFRGFLNEQRPSILMEILDDETGRKVQNIIDGIPYLYFNLHEKGAIRRVKQLTKSDDFNYLICTAEVAKQIGLTAQ